MRHFIRKTTPKVVRGKVCPKSRTTPTWNFDSPASGELPSIIREKPGPGFRHVLKKRDIERFLHLLPDWKQLSSGLNAIVLAQGETECDGWHAPGIVAICAWERGLWRKDTQYDYENDRDLLQRLEVPIESGGGKLRVCKFTEASVRGFQLLRVLLHELGHHHDQMTTRSRKQPSRGELYAESYARKHEKQIWHSYLSTFGLY